MTNSPPLVGPSSPVFGDTRELQIAQPLIGGLKIFYKPRQQIKPLKAFFIFPTTKSVGVVSSEGTVCCVTVCVGLLV